MSFKVKDHYFKKAKKENFLARSVYKLEELDKKFELIKGKRIILDLGYYPGSWTQFVLQHPHFKAKLVGIDIQEVNEKLNQHPMVNLFQMDIDDVQNLGDLGIEGKADLIISDMAPKTTGVKTVDQLRSLNIVECVFYKLDKFLASGGDLVVKVFDSHDAQIFLKSQRKRFDRFEFLKPKSTRKVSKEFFVIGKSFL